MPGRAVTAVRGAPIANIKLAITTAIMASVALVLVTGCAGTAAARRVSVDGCAAGAVQAATRAAMLHTTVTGLPAPCRGLRPAALGKAAATAVAELAGIGHKAERRRGAVTASRSLGYLIAAARRAQAAAGRAHASAPGAPGSGSRSAGTAAAAGGTGSGIPVGVAALIAWLLTAGSGSYLLVGWLAHGGMHRVRTSSSGLPPAVILSHFGLAVSGLAVWVAYLLTGAAAVAWIAGCLLLPVTGLGLATLIQTIPDSGQGKTTARSGARAPVVVIAAHGLLATTTLLLALLAAVTAS